MTNEKIVASARSWTGTRFHHQGRLKKTESHKGGVDCLGLLVGVAQELDLRGKFGEILSLQDETDYSHQPDTKKLYAKLAQFLVPIPSLLGEKLLPGDVVLLAIEGSPQHLGIISDYGEGLGLIHAYAPARSVVEHALDDGWRNKITAAFRVFVIPDLIRDPALTVGCAEKKCFSAADRGFAGFPPTRE